MRRPRISLLLLALLGACAEGPAGEVSGSEAQFPLGRWRAVAVVQGNDLPFSIDFARAGNGQLAATLVNGVERVPVGEVALAGDALTLDFPAFNNRLSLARDGDGYAGALTLIKRGGVRQVMPLRLTPAATYRFFATPQLVVGEFGGTWAVQFVDVDGNETQAVAEFHQDGGNVTGTFRTPTGDYRFLAGEVHDRTLLLSTFDGAHAFVFHAVQNTDGTLQGDFWSGTSWHETWTARRDATASLPDPNQMSRLRDDVEAVRFAFPNTRGDIVAQSDPQFENKVLIVALAGSWCPNCHDEAAFLAPFYHRFKDRGLEVVGLMFEHLDNFEEAAVQVNRFRDKFDIGYELLVAGGSDKKIATEKLNILDRVIAYPTMIVVDRSGVVRRVHTGFDGPGTGGHYAQFTREFEEFVQQLLAEEMS